MRVISYMPIHYGREYLRESILSFIDLVDYLHIFYSPVGSMGRRVDEQCPETREELKGIAKNAGGDKVIWHDIETGSEAEHRQLIFKYSKGYDLVFTSDADEIWDSKELGAAMNQAYKMKEGNIGIKGFINLWRSFNWHVVDQFRPIRIYNLNGNRLQGEVKCTVWHMGYCQREEIMRYKFKIHGHREIDQAYVDNVYYAWKEDNQIKYLHPASRDVWVKAEPYNKFDMPKLLIQHENFNKQYV